MRDRRSAAGLPATALRRALILLETRATLKAIKSSLPSHKQLGIPCLPSQEHWRMRLALLRACQSTTSGLMPSASSKTRGRTGKPSAPVWGDYYRNARVTISALDSASSDAGFLHKRVGHRTAGMVGVAPLHPHKAGNVRVGLMPPSRRDVFRAASLIRRGWALQERLLAARVLHYKSSRLFWECLSCTMSKDTTAAEVEQTDMSELVYSEGGDFKRCLWTTQQEEQPHPHHTTATAAEKLSVPAVDHHCIRWGTFSLWYRLVSQFTSMELTVASDRIPAIGAIAERIGCLTWSQYAHGLFAGDPSGLCWVRGDASTGKGTRIIAHTTLVSQRPEPA